VETCAFFKEKGGKLTRKQAKPEEIYKIMARQHAKSGEKSRKIHRRIIQIAYCTVVQDTRENLTKS
jgi:hypothetical protein